MGLDLGCKGYVVIMTSTVRKRKYETVKLVKATYR